MKLSKGWKITLRVAGGIVLALCIVFVIGVEYATHHIRQVVVKSLQKQFHADVQLDSIEMKMGSPIQVTGAGLVMYPQGHDDSPPLISIKSFSAQARWSGLLRRHIAHLTIVGLEVTVPTGQPGDDERARESNFIGRFTGVLFDDVESENAKVTVLPSESGKQPEVIDVASLRGHSISGDGKLAADATIRSAIPPGDIVTTGTFGPWDPDVPARTPVSGSFSFKDVDLSTLPGGLAGRLSAEGQYGGIIEKLNVDGTAAAPDFATKTSEQPVDLKANFHVVIDGAKEETRLQNLDAHFEHSTLHAVGTIAGTPGQQGQAIHLDVSATDARIEDLLALTVKDKPALTGNIRLNTTLILPAGPQNDPMNQMTLNGSFDIDQVVFTDHAAEKKVTTLSMRSQGQTGDVQEDDSVASAMQGMFQVQNGVMTFSDLNFQVPGARVHLVGTIGLEHQNFDMHGVLDMRAQISQTTTGVKSFLLKAVNPLFSKPGGGSRIFFNIGGTEKIPIYTLDLHHKAAPDKTPDQSSTKTNTAAAQGN
ncbi:MAG: AsmA-like C-terminal region-containing protein [Candidatus Acidiferrales bacterium]